MKNYSMKMFFLKKNTNIFNNMPMPSNISYLWNYGSLLGSFLIVQILTGLFLSMHYSSTSMEAFLSISHIMRNVQLGWLTRLIHANGASFFFMLIYLHISRNLYYSSYKIYYTWLSGIIILFLSMMIAFMGYILPWGQMSFWGATVITNLLSAIPYMGKSMTLWIWGGFSINNSTLMRFFSLHFILPLIMILLIMLHLSSLHMKGSSNPIGSNSNLDKMPFMPFFFWKDLFWIMLLSILFMFVCLIKPYTFMDPDNFSPANPLITPIHIQPEWYFLFAYAILRSIPNKLGGVLCLFMSILLFLLLPTITINYLPNFMNPLNKMYLFYWMSNFIFLTYLGSRSISYPFIYLSQLSSLFYFTIFFNHYFLYYYSLLKK